MTYILESPAQIINFGSINNGDCNFSMDTLAIDSNGQAYEVGDYD